MEGQREKKVISTHLILSILCHFYPSTVYPHLQGNLGRTYLCQIHPYIDATSAQFLPWLVCFQLKYVLTHLVDMSTSWFKCLVIWKVCVLRWQKKHKTNKNIYTVSKNIMCWLFEKKSEILTLCLQLFESGLVFCYLFKKFC